MTVLVLDYIFDRMKRSTNPTGIGQFNTAAETMSIGTSPRRNSSTSSSGSGARAAAAGTVAKRPGKRPGRKPSKVDEHAKLERSRQSARECRARKKLRYQYLEELVLSREKAVFALRDELETLRQLCLQMESDVNVPEALLKAILSEDYRAQRLQRQEEQQVQQKPLQQAQQEGHTSGRWPKSSTSSSDSEPPKMSLQQHQQIQLQRWHHQRQLQQQSGGISNQQGTSRQQQRLSPMENVQHVVRSSGSTHHPLTRQVAVDIPHVPVQGSNQPRALKSRLSSESIFERNSSLESITSPPYPTSLSYTPTAQVQRGLRPISTDSGCQRQSSNESLFSPNSNVSHISREPSFEMAQHATYMLSSGEPKVITQHQPKIMSHFHKMHHNRTPYSQRSPPSHAEVNAPVPSKALELFTGNTIANTINSNNIVSIPSVKNITPIEEIDSSDENEILKQPLFQSAHSTFSDPVLQSLTQPSPRPLTPNRRFPSPTPSKSSSPFDPHARLRRLTNVYCYSATRTSNTPSPSPFSSIPVGHEMTPSPHSYRTSTTPSSSATLSPAPLMTLNTFLDISGSSLTSVVSDMMDETSGSESALPNFLFSQQMNQPVSGDSTGMNTPISESIPQFYSFLADLQDVDSTLSSHTGRPSGHSAPATSVSRSNEQVPTSDTSTLNLPTIISDFLNNTHNQTQQ